MTARPLTLVRGRCVFTGINRMIGLAPAHTSVASRGFTVIELVLVIAVTLLIGALGVSAFWTYVIRARIADSIGTTIGIQEQVVQAFRHTGLPPADRREAGLPPSEAEPTMDIAAVEIADGRIEIHFAETAETAIANRTLSLTPFETVDQQVVWICGNKIPGVGLKPLGFAGGARQAVQVLTSIEPRYLPPTCR